MFVMYLYFLVQNYLYALIVIVSGIAARLDFFTSNGFGTFFPSHASPHGRLHSLNTEQLELLDLCPHGQYCDLQWTQCRA